MRKVILGCLNRIEFGNSMGVGRSKNIRDGKGRLAAVFMHASIVFSGLTNGFEPNDVQAGSVNPLYRTTMESGNKINPERFVQTSVAWVIGEDEPIIIGKKKQPDVASGSDSYIDQQFYTGSLVKPLVYLAVMQKIEGDRLAVLRGDMKPEDALRMDSVLSISKRAREISNHRSFEETLSVEEALPLMLSFSMNDVTHAFAERVSYGKILPSNIAVKDSITLEQDFVLEYMRPLAKDIGMEDTFLVNSTGLPTYRDKGAALPTWFNNVSTPHDMMVMFNYISQNYPQYYALSSHAQVVMPNRDKPFMNSNPLLENSAREDGVVRSIPVDGVKGGKTGLSNVSLWNAVIYYEGGEKPLGVLTTGNLNVDYARRPKEVLDHAVRVLREKRRDNLLDFD